VILADMMPTEETINSDAYIRELTELKKCFKWIRPNKNPTQILLQHDNEWPHTSLRTWKAIIKFGWTVLPHPPYTPIKHTQISTYLETRRMQSALRRFRPMTCIAQQEFSYMGMTRHIANKIYIHFFLVGMTL